MDEGIAVQHARGSDGKILNIALWIAQAAIFVLFGMSALMKLTFPIPQLAGIMPWTGQLPTTFVRFIGVVDLAGSLGIILPSLTRIFPRVTVLAALGCTVLQILAICFHSWRGEFSSLPLNFVLLPLSVFVLWGRSSKAPIRSR
ncbi:MAG: DoxX family protein [Rhizomicrobium sp.]